MIYIYYICMYFFYAGVSWLQLKKSLPPPRKLGMPTFAFPNTLLGHGATAGCSLDVSSITPQSWEIEQNALMFPFA
jgi:hypothetical protein